MKCAALGSVFVSVAQLPNYGGAASMPGVSYQNVVWRRVAEVDKEEYRRMVDAVMMLLEGRGDKLLRQLKKHASGGGRTAL